MRRRIARLICRALRHLLPRAMRGWADVIAAEVTAIEDDRAAFGFGVDSLRGALAIHVHRAADALLEGPQDMDRDSDGAKPQALGQLCGAGAVLLGLAYMAAAGAPARYLILNVAALAIGVALVAFTSALRPKGGSGLFVLASGAALLATALFGDRAEGAARWITVGSVFVQPSLVLLPAAIMAFARRPGTAATLGMLVAALALALQPDRAMAAMLFAAAAILTIMRPSRGALSVFVGATLAFAATLGRADTLPAVPFVDQILYTSFDVHPAAGTAVLGGTILLLLPALIGWLRDPERRALYGAFAAVWISAVGAAGLGNYPTPLVGYGGSAVIGYVLSAAMLPGRRARRSVAGAQAGEPRVEQTDLQLRIAVQPG